MMALIWVMGVLAYLMAGVCVAKAEELWNNPSEDASSVGLIALFWPLRLWAWMIIAFGHVLCKGVDKLGEWIKAL